MSLLLIFRQRCSPQTNYILPALPPCTLVQALWFVLNLIIQKKKSEQPIFSDLIFKWLITNSNICVSFPDGERKELQFRDLALKSWKVTQSRTKAADWWWKRIKREFNINMQIIGEENGEEADISAKSRIAWIKIAYCTSYIVQCTLYSHWLQTRPWKCRWSFRHFSESISIS